MKCGYWIKFGNANYTVQYRYTPYNNQPGVWSGWTNFTAYQTWNGSSYANATHPHTMPGTYVGTARVTGLPGTYTVQARCTDGNVPPTTSTYTGWASFNCAPAVQVAMLLEPMDQAPIDPGDTYKRDVTKLKYDLEVLYGTGTVTTYSISTPLTVNQLAGKNLVIWTSDAASYYNYSSYYYGGSYYYYGYAELPGTATEINRVHTAEGASVFIVGGGAHAKSGWVTTTAWRQNTPYCLNNSVSVWTGGYNIAAQLRNTSDTIPNNIPNVQLGTKIANPLFGSWQYGYFCQWTTSALRSYNDSANYPAANCNFMVRSTYDFGDLYAIGLYAKRSTGLQGNLISLAENWGDLATYQSYTGGTIHRAAILENLLCCRDSTSRFNSSVTIWP